VEVLLFTACRAEMAEKSVRPALAAGRDVVCERFVSSTLVYQGTIGGVDRAWIESVSAAALCGTRPDRVIVLDLPAEEALERRSHRTTVDRFESRGVAYQQRVREGFLALARSDASYVVVSARGDPDEVEARVRACVSDLFPRLPPLAPT
jgi:dTMP kinase